MIETIDPFIYVEDNVIPDNICDEIIKKFEESNDAQFQGKINGGEIKTNIKDSVDLDIGSWYEWKPLHTTLMDSLKPFVDRYVDHCITTQSRKSFSTGDYLPFGPPLSGWIQPTPFQLQKTAPGKGYVWHNDYYPGRVLTQIFYLNDVEEGYTEFRSGDKVQPKKGRGCLFPSEWTYFHQGYPPKNDKYIAIGWIMKQFYLQEINHVNNY